MERKPDTIEFVVIDRATVYIVNPTGSVEGEWLDLPGALERIVMYAEGEWVCEYMAGDDMGEDLEFIETAAQTAGIKLWEVAIS